jgi:hypothetical protein
MVNDPPPEDLLAMAHRHVREGEARVARQEELVANLRRDGHKAAAMRGEAVLVQMRRALDLGRRHLTFELKTRVGTRQTHAGTGHSADAPRPPDRAE